MPNKPKLQAKAQPRERSRRGTALNLALQGGGSHGAFTWGVLDWLLERGCIFPAAVSGASAGSMNLAALAHGWSTGKHEGARESLETFWMAISEAGRAFAPIRLPGKAMALSDMFTENPWTKMATAFSNHWVEALLRAASPYQLNPFNINPLKSTLEQHIDFERLRAQPPFKCFVATTRINDGKLQVFREHELSADVIMASACLPTIFQAVKVGDHFYWDGGYTADPALWPFFYESTCDDTLLVMVNPLHREALPKTQEDIVDRLNEISFNASLNAEMRAIAFVRRLHSEGWLKPSFEKKLRNPRLHAVLADEALSDLSMASKLNTEQRFLVDLKQRGRKAAEHWWLANHQAIGKHGSFDERNLL